MEACVLVFGILFGVIPGILHLIEVARKASDEAADERLLQDNPEAWKAKEQVKLDKERLEAQKKYADGESRRKNAGTIAHIIRIFFG